MTDIDTMLAEAMAHHTAGRLEPAADGYRDILDREPRQPNACNLLALIALDVGYTQDAVQLTGFAVESAPRVAPFWTNRGDALAAAGRAEDAVNAYERSRELDPSSLATHVNLGLALHRMRRDEAATESFERALQIEPTQPTALHLLAALTGQVSESPPDEYVEALFDSYAETFEDHLQNTLSYTVPADLRKLLSPLTDDQWFVVDVGCGTGLMGEALAGSFNRLVGGDLSGKMLQRAAAKNLYTELRQEDALATLASFDNEVDLVVAADMLIYISDLTPILAAAHRALRPGGQLALSIENAEDKLILRPNGRFSHVPAELEAAAKAVGFTLEHREDNIGRSEAGAPVHGSLYVFKSAE